MVKRVQCPNCKTQNITLRTRRVYFTRALICLFLAILGLFEIYTLKGEDLDPVVMIGGGASILLFTVSMGVGIYELIKGVLTKENNYKCESCNHKFSEGLIVYIDDEQLMKMIRK